MMKKILLGLILAGGSVTVNAQVGIGTTAPNQSSQLEIVSSDKGVLIPQVALSSSTDVLTISNGNVESLLVYNKNTVADVRPGYYYWFAGRWRRVVSDADVDLTTTTLIDNGDGRYTFTNEKGVVTVIDIPTNETKTTLVYDSAAHTLTYNGESGVPTLIPLDDLVETTTTLTDNTNGTYTYTNEKGAVTTVDVPASVINNAGDIFGNTNVVTEVTKIVKDAETLTSLFGNADRSFTYIDENATPVTINGSDLETPTTLVDNADGTYTYTNEKSVATTVDVPASVINNAGDIFGNTNVVTEVTKIVKDAETLTSLVGNADRSFTYIDENTTPVTINGSDLETPTTLVDNTDGTYTYTNEKSVATTVDVPASVINNAGDIFGNTNVVTEVTKIVKDAETVTTLVNNNDGTFTYTNEAGTAVTVDAADLETTTTLVDNTNGTYTYTNEKGAITTVDVPASVVNNAGDIFGNTNVITEVTEIVKDAETVTTLVNNNDGTFTYTNEAGTAVTVDAADLETTTTLTDNTNGTYTYTNEKGAVTTVDVPASVINNAGDIFGNTNVVTEVTAIVKDAETVTTLVNNNDGTFTYTNEAGTAVTVDAADLETTTTLTDNTNGTYTYTNEKGAVTTVDVPASVINNAVDIFGNTNVVTEVTKIVKDAETLTSLVGNADRSFTYIDENATPVTINGSDLETPTTLVDNTDGTYTYTNEKSVATTVDVPASVINNVGDIFGNTNVVTEVTKIVHDAETVTTLVNNNDGTFTYINEKTAPVTINGSDLETTTTLAIAAGALTYNNEDASNANVNLISTDVNNTIVAGTDGALYAAGMEPWYIQSTTNKATVNTDNIFQMGNVGIGTNNMLNTANTNVKLAVNGAILTTNSIYADYVFEDYLKGHSELNSAYSFKSLNEIEKFINENKHLPGITSIKDLKKNEKGEYIFNMSELSIQTLEKIEELFLHTIEQQKQLDAKEKAIQEMKVQLLEMTQQIKSKEEKIDLMNQRLENLEKLFQSASNN